MNIILPFMLFITSAAYLDISLFRDNNYMAEPVLLLLCVAGTQLVKKKKDQPLIKLSFLSFFLFFISCCEIVLFLQLTETSAAQPFFLYYFT